MKIMNFVRPLLISALLLLVPLLASQVVEGWNWSTGDYFFAGVMFYITGLLFELGGALSSNLFYRAGFGLALLTGFMIVWGNLAVGFIGSEDNPINLIYFAVLAVAFLSAIVARFKAHSMSYVMYATALGTALVPVVGLLVGSTFNENPPGVGVGTAGVFGLNTFFVVLFIGSGLLFKNAAMDQKQVQL